MGASPAVANGVVYAGGEGGGFFALDAETGAKLWSSEGYVVSAPAVANGVIYISDVAGYSLRALDAATGAELWSYATGDVLESSPAVANGMVWVASRDDNVYAFHLPGR